MYGFYRVATAINKTVVANPHKNAQETLNLIKQANKQEVCAVVFPELTLTGYTASDLLLHSTLIQTQYDALQTILKETKDISTVAIIGIAFCTSIDSTTVPLLLNMGKF